MDSDLPGAQRCASCPVLQPHQHFQDVKQDLLIKSKKSIDMQNAAGRLREAQLAEGGTVGVLVEGRTSLAGVWAGPDSQGTQRHHGRPEDSRGEDTATENRNCSLDDRPRESTFPGLVLP